MRSTELVTTQKGTASTPKRVQIVTRIGQGLRKEMGRDARRHKTTLNALIEAALGRYLRNSPGSRDHPRGHSSNDSLSDEQAIVVRQVPEPL